jgi:hypothetical protein
LIRQARPRLRGTETAGRHVHNCLGLTVTRGIGHTGRLEARSTQSTGITATAGTALLVRCVAGDGETIIHTKSRSLANDVRLAPPNKRGVDVEITALDPRLGRQTGHVFKSGNEFRPAVRVTRVVHRVDADENIPGAQHLRPAECQA